MRGALKAHHCTQARSFPNQWIRSQIPNPHRSLRGPARRLGAHRPPRLGLCAECRVPTVAQSPDRLTPCVARHWLLASPHQPSLARPRANLCGPRMASASPASHGSAKTIGCRSCSTATALVALLRACACQSAMEGGKEQVH